MPELTKCSLLFLYSDKLFNSTKIDFKPTDQNTSCCLILMPVFFAPVVKCLKCTFP